MFLRMEFTTSWCEISLRLKERNPVAYSAMTRLDLDLADIIETGDYSPDTRNRAYALTSTLRRVDEPIRAMYGQITYNHNRHLLAKKEIAEAMTMADVVSVVTNRPEIKEAFQQIDDELTVPIRYVKRWNEWIVVAFRRKAKQQPSP